MITTDDYMRKIHIYLETSGGREEVFKYLFKQLKKGLEQEKRSLYMSALFDLKAFLTGHSPLFVNSDLPNIFRLRKERENIKKDALSFLKTHIELIKTAYVQSTLCRDKFETGFLLLKFLPEIKDLPLVHFADLYLLLSYTLHYLDEFQGTEQDKADLATIALKGLARYDGIQMAEYFITRPEDKAQLETYTNLPPYESYLQRLRQAVEWIQKQWRSKKDFPVHDFLPLVFTDNALYILNQIHNALLEEIFFKYEDKVKIALFKRLENLFKKPEIKQEIQAILTGFLKDKQKAIQQKTTSGQIITPENIQHAHFHFISTETQNIFLS